MALRRHSSKAVTIHDVAAAAGVAAKTVSRVVRELDYHPSQSARSLASRRSSLIGLFHDNPSANYR